MYAIISDLHSNIEALGAVMDDMSAFDVDSICCLGDAIGYGPNPREVLAIAKDCRFILMGNHEEGLLHFAADFNPRARAALEWTKEQLNDPGLAKDEIYGYWTMLDGLSKLERSEDAMYVHGSLRNETKDYVMPEDIADQVKMSEIFGLMDRRICFFGHTHIPGVWSEEGKYIRPSEVDHEYVVPSQKVVINVGSVGQPRDGDNRACYVLVDGDRIIFRRVEYDFKSTMRKIMRVEMLSDTLAARLKVGR